MTLLDRPPLPDLPAGSVWPNRGGSVWPNWTGSVWPNRAPPYVSREWLRLAELQVALITRAVTVHFDGFSPRIVTLEAVPVWVASDREPWEEPVLLLTPTPAEALEETKRLAKGTGSKVRVTIRRGDRSRPFGIVDEKEPSKGGG